MEGCFYRPGFFSQNLGLDIQPRCSIQIGHPCARRLETIQIHGVKYYGGLSLQASLFVLGPRSLRLHIWPRWSNWDRHSNARSLDIKFSHGATSHGWLILETDFFSQFFRVQDLAFAPYGAFEMDIHVLEALMPNKFKEQNLMKGSFRVLYP